MTCDLVFNVPVSSEEPMEVNAYKGSAFRVWAVMPASDQKRPLDMSTLNNGHSRRTDVRRTRCRARTTYEQPGVTSRQR